MSLSKNNIIVICILVVITALLIYVFAISANVKKVDLNVLMTLNDEEYSIDDFYKYRTITNEKNGDISKVVSGDELETMLDDFTKFKIYAYAANTKNITVPEEKITEFKTTYADKQSTFNQYGITEEDYIKYSEEDYKNTELSNNFSSYYELPEEYYNELAESYSGDQKTYSYRLMYFAYDEPEVESETISGDSGETVSGEAISGESEDVTLEETSGDTETEDTAEETEDRSRDTILAKAQSVLDQLNNGGEFESLAKENASYRISFVGSSYQLLNGELEYSTSPLIQSKLNSEVLYNKIKEMQAGETSEVIEDEESNSLYILKLENVEDGFVGDGDKELREVLLSEYKDTLVLNGISYDVNQATLLKVLYQ